MSGETIVTIVGNLVDDPALRFTPSGAPVANFTIASTPRTFDKASNEWKDGDTLFLNCSVWRQAAENVAESLTQGMRVIVQGRLKSRSFETREGERRTVFEIDVDEVGPSLAWATARVERSDRNSTRQGQSRPQETRSAAPRAQSRPAAQQAPSNDPWASAPDEKIPF